MREEGGRGEKRVIGERKRREKEDKVKYIGGRKEGNKNRGS